jgi:hypothetical protein
VNRWDININGSVVNGVVKSGCFNGNGSGITKVTFVNADEKSRPHGVFDYVMIKTAVWDQEWEKDDEHYLPKSLSAIPEYRLNDSVVSQKKIQSLTAAVLNSGKINSPSFLEVPQGAKIRIADGRHRIYLLRELGIDAFPAAVPILIIPRLQDLGLLA